MPASLGEGRREGVIRLEASQKPQLLSPGALHSLPQEQQSGAAEKASD